MRLRWVALITFLSLGIAGCGSARFASTLKPSENPSRTVGERYRIVGVSLQQSGGPASWHGLSDEGIKQRASRLYPEIFAGGYDGIPLFVSLKGTFHEQSMGGAFLTALTVGVIPFPSSQRSDISVSVTLFDEKGAKRQGEPVAFTREDSLWMSLIGPLGCIPIPGESDLPRDTVFLMIGSDNYVAKTKQLTNDAVVEAIVKGIEQFPAGERTRLAAARRSRVRKVEIDGKSYWSVIVPVYSKGVTTQESADSYRALLFDAEPSDRLKPLDDLLVARRDPDGRWVPVTAYPRRVAKRLIALNALLEGGVPARLAVSEVTDPPIEDFLTVPLSGLPDEELAADLRWNNRVLLEIKNKGIAPLLTTRTNGELLDLVTQIEKGILDIGRENDLARDRAVSLAQEGKDVTAVRDLTLAYRERIDILKAILTVLKQGVTARGN
ncbi:MAG: hypothetical protein Fur0034_00820 [Desulfuromonadia bacterium]